MEVRRHLLTAAIAATTVVALPAAPALAAAPANDTWTSAYSITSVPYSMSEDTSTATTGPVDKLVRQRCGAPYVLGSVWFKYTPSTATYVMASTAGSSFEAGVAIMLGRSSDPRLLACGPTRTVAEIPAGRHAHLVAFSYVRGVRGGELVFKVTRVQPPQITTTVADIVTVAQDGQVTVSGTITCSRAPRAWAYVVLRQAVGRLILTGEGDMDEQGVACDGTAVPWSLSFYAWNGRFAPGNATVSVYASACNRYICTPGDVTKDVKVRH
jgi:hypothetical protein